MKNKEVIDAFLKHRSANAGNLFSTGKELFSYRTIIAYWDKDLNVVVNATKYSTTTSHHLGILLSELAKKYVEIQAGDNVPMGSTEFIPNCILRLTEKGNWKNYGLK